MFSKATASFVRQIDQDGSLIHVSRLNNSHKLVPMALVVKRKRFWFWQRPKYQPSDFTLSDLLLGDTPLSPGVSETEFLSYQGTFGDHLRGVLNVKAGGVNVDLEGGWSSKLHSSFGKLKKQQVDINKLLSDSSGRLVNMQHFLVQQLEKRDEVLAVLKERILTTSACSITRTHLVQSSCAGALDLMGKLGKAVEVCVKERNIVQADSDVSIEIPAATVIAYSLMELEIKKDGHFKPCLQPHTLGGFETDSGTSSPSHSSSDTHCVVDGFGWSALDPMLQELEVCLCPLAQLPARHALFQKLVEMVERDIDSLSSLEHMLEEWCRAEVPVMPDIMESSVGCSSLASDFLNLLRPTPVHQMENARSGTPAHVTAAHLLVSAMEELPDETLSLLIQCSPENLDAINDHDDEALSFLENLLRSSNVSLRRVADSLCAQTGNEAGQLPLVLCVTVRGFGNRVWVKPQQVSGGNYIQPSSFSSHGGDDWGRGGGNAAADWGKGGVGGSRKENAKSSEFSFSSQNRYSTLNTQHAFDKGGRGGDEQDKNLETIKSDMEIWETSGQWVFSCYALSVATISGFADVSPEELRLEYYKSRASGELQSYANGINQLVNQWRSRVQELRAMNAASRVALLAELNNPAPQESSAGFGLTKPVFGSSASSFGTGFDAPAPAQASGFSFAPPTGGGFGSSASSTLVKPPSGFGSASSTQSASSFSFAAPGANKTPAAAVPLGSASAFSFASTAPAASAGFGGGFGAGAAGTGVGGGGGVFGQAGVVIGAAGASGPEVSTGARGSAGGVSDCLFTPQSQLTPEELNQFAAKRFTLGQIPLKPPPADMLV